ncbi:MAG: hypothetical protein AUJ98_04765 [Bacteroidetes bacterium CG2_30_33_31]|nr:MAG: hypothetical protein AUJ98_04765 [Bacteroidetes bacterium CG2_30_33_31]
MRKFLVIFLILSFLSPAVYSQSKSKIQLVGADILAYDKNSGADVQKLIGNVTFSHKASILKCDSAYLYGNSNKVKAYGNVHIIDNGNVNIYSDSLIYEGNNRLAELFNNIKFTDQTMNMTTNHLKYNLSTKIGSYFDGGKIINADNDLKSVYGIFNTANNTVFFKKNVVLVNPEYTINCDTLIYNTNTEISTFLGPTTIVSKENFIYCEKGWYNSKTDKSRFGKNAYLRNDHQRIQGDSLFYNRTNNSGKAFHNVILKDTAQKLIIYCNYIDYQGDKQYSLCTDNALAIILDNEKDSIFLHADTLMLYFDSLQKAKEVYAYHKAIIYKSDLQGLCDSMIYSLKDSIIEMYKKPVLWSGKNQLSGDYIKILTLNNKPKELHIMENSFVFSRDTLAYFNQISGKNMIGYFADNELNRLDVKGNAETIYFARDDKKNLIGVDISVASDLKIFIEKKQIKNIIYFDEPTGTLFPLKDVAEKDQKLKNFENLNYARPRGRKDIFLWKMK